MKTLAFVLGLQFFTVYASDFSIQPYILQTQDQRVILRYQLANSKNIIAEQTEGFKSDVLFEGEVQANKLESISSKVMECGESIKLEIKDKETSHLLFSKNLEGPACPDQKVLRPFIFGFISDTQEFDVRHQAIAKVIEQKLNENQTQFILNTGDIVQEGHEEKEWIQFLNTGNIYMGKVPLITAIGNHDFRGTKGKNVIPKLFKKYLRWNDDDQGDMVFDFEQFRLMVFNSNYFKLTRKAEKKQLEWMIEQFEEARRLKVPMIVSMHYPIFSSSLNKFTSGSVIKMRRRLEPLFREYGIKLVLSGHTHMYERSYKDGVHYVVAGPAGGRINSPSFKNKYKKFINPDILTYTEFKIHDGILQMKTWDEAFNLVDSIMFKLNE
ncbi:MAG: hypothetical protein OHK0056_23170 [Bacteriovoracaceae bacterium]